MNSRLESLDIFRGITVGGMILVNNPGSWDFMYPSVRHAKWNGCTFADLVFPFFLFIVGVSVYFSFSKAQTMLSSSQVYKKIIIRTVTLFCLGLLLHGFPEYDFSEIRIPGVLQRIAIVYFFSGILFINFSQKSLWMIFSGILVFYTMLFLLVIPPGQNAPNLEPGKNIAAYIDSIFLKGHMWKYTKTWDPEGILSTLTATATSVSGILAGYLLKSSRGENNQKADTRIQNLLITGTVFTTLGWVLDFIFPINKNLWTSSYVLFTSGLACIAFTLLYYLVDISKIKGSGILKFLFLPMGLNALALYFVSGIVARSLNIIKIQTGGSDIPLKSYIYSGVFGKITSTPLASLGFSLLFLLFLFLLGLVLYRLKIIIKI